MKQRVREGALTPTATPDAPPAATRLVPVGLAQAEFAWPWPCHRVGHTYEDGDRCVHCKARYEWDDIETILTTAKLRFRDKRRAELKNYFTLPSGLLLDLT